MIAAPTPPPPPAGKFMYYVYIPVPSLSPPRSKYQWSNRQMRWPQERLPRQSVRRGQTRTVYPETQCLLACWPARRTRRQCWLFGGEHLHCSRICRDSNDAAVSWQTPPFDWSGDAAVQPCKEVTRFSGAFECLLTSLQKINSLLELQAVNTRRLL